MSNRTASPRLTVALGLRVVVAVAVALVVGLSVMAVRQHEPPDHDRDAYRTAFLELADEVLARLDELEERNHQRIEQLIEIEKARAATIQAEKQLELAKIAVREYLEGTYPQEHAKRKGELEHARQDVRLGEDWLKRADAWLEQNVISEDQYKVGQLSLERARLEVEKAETALMVLEEFTKQKHIVELEGEVQKAEAAFQAAQESWEYEKRRISHIEWQIRLGQLSEREIQVLALLDEAIRFEDQMRADGAETERLASQAQAKLNEASTIWQEIQAEREAQREAEVKRRLRGAVSLYSNQAPSTR